MRHNRARLLVARDLNAFLRLECLGALVRSGLAGALTTPGPPAALAARAGLCDVDLTTALLDTGVAFRLIRRRGSSYSARGARMRAACSSRAQDVSGMAEEAVAYDGPIYANLADHLRGAPRQDYDAGLGDVIARVSRVVEPIVGPWMAAEARRSRARRVLDVGCGSAVNLRWIAEALPGAERVCGIDLDAEAIAGASANLASWGLGDRVAVAVADLQDLPTELMGPWDLVVLAQNIYYWPVDQRSDVLRRLRALTAGAGTILVPSAVPSRSAIGRHLDLALRVTATSYQLPTLEELRGHAVEAGFTEVRVRDLLPGAGMGALVARG